MLEPEQVIPPKLRDALRALDRWFLIGGQAVRCFKPYRPTRDVDIGVANTADFKKVSAALRRAGAKAIESAADSVHFDLDGIDVSVFVLPRVARFVEGRRLALTGLLGTKLHAILDRGTRRDFFDLYVMMQDQHVSITDAMAALRAMHGDLNEGLLLRALCFFDDADREARLPGEGPKDWAAVKRYFQEQVGRLVVPPLAELAIASRVVDVSAPKKRAPARRKRPR